MKQVALESIAAIGLISMLPQVVLGCTYSYSYSYYSNYDLCNGSVCSWDSDCASNYCNYGYCSNYQLPPWAITLIVFFSLFIFFSIIGACRRRRIAKMR